MKKLLTVACVLWMFAAFTAADLAAKDAPKKAVNKTCPVGGEPVDPESGTFEYKGKTYGVCCDSCIEKFKANPEKYEKNLKEDAK